MNPYASDLLSSLRARMTDPIPRLIFADLAGEPAPDALLCEVRSSPLYAQLAAEQRPDGSYGRFHTMDSSDKKPKFKTTESAIRRARELALPGGDPIVEKLVSLLKRYLTGADEWTDNVESHQDAGRSHMAFRRYIDAANLAIFEPRSPLLTPYRETCARQLAAACEGGGLDEALWTKMNLEYRGAYYQPWMVYPFLLMRESDLDAGLQRKYLDYIWNREGGMYYVSDVAPASLPPVGAPVFTKWLASLEALCGFACLPELTRAKTAPHLTAQLKLLMSGEAALPPARPIEGRYSRTWRAKGAREADMALRILRLMKKIDA